jgi:PKD domain
MLAILGRPARLALAALGLLGALCVGIGEDEARAAWIAPFAISSLGTTASEPQVAADGQGDVTFAWTSGSGNTGIMVTEHAAGGVWFPPVERIPSSFDCHDPRLAVNQGGAVIVVADCDAGTALMRSVSRAAVGGWSSSVAISGTTGGQEPRVGIDNSGNAAMVFAGSGSTVQGANLPAGGSWSSIVQLSTVGKTASKPNMAMTPTGAADAAWLEKRENTGSDPVVDVRFTRTHGSSAWTTASSRLTANFGPSAEVPVAEGEPLVDVSNEWQIVGWQQSTSGTALVVERTASNDSGGFVEPATLLSEAGSIEAPALAIDASGRNIAAWRGFSLSFPGSFELRGSTTAFSNGSWASPSILEEAGPTGATEPELAVDAGGNATVAWNPVGSMIRAAARGAGGAFGPATTISNASHTGFGVPVVGAVVGDGVVAWPSSTGGSHVALAIDDVTPPSLLAPSPVSATIGSPVALSATATDLWGFPSVKWDFGDGATATGSSVSHTYASAGTRTATVTATDAGGNTASASVTVVVTDPSAGTPGGGPGGSGGSVTPPPPPPPHIIKVTAARSAQPWTKQAKAKAIQVKCKLDVDGTCTAVATVTKATARKLGLPVPKGSKPVPIGRGSASATANRFVIVKVMLKPKALSAIAASAKPIQVGFALKGTGSGDPGAASSSLTLHP